MGLDSVELIVDVENTFQISISDPEAESVETVGKFYELILSKIDYSKHHKCQTQVLFYKLREVMSRHCMIEKKGIKPETQLDTIFMSETIKEKWKAIQDEVYFNMPDLKRSKKLSGLLNTLSFIFISAAIVLLITVFITSNYLLLLYVLGFISLTYLIWRLTRHLKKYPSHSNMRNLVMAILPLSIKNLDLSIRDKNDVLHVLKYIIHDKIGVDMEEITLDAHFVNDLGLN